MNYQVYFTGIKFKFGDINREVKEKLVVVMFVSFAISDEFMESPIFLLLITFDFVGWVIYFSIKFRSKYQSQLMGFATDTDNNVYSAMKLNNGEEFVIGGMAAGGIIDAV